MEEDLEDELNKVHTTIKLIDIECDLKMAVIREDVSAFVRSYLGEMHFSKWLVWQREMESYGHYPDVEFRVEVYSVFVILFSTWISFVLYCHIPFQADILHLKCPNYIQFFTSSKIHHFTLLYFIHLSHQLQNPPSFISISLPLLLLYPLFHQKLYPLTNEP